MPIYTNFMHAFRMPNLVEISHFNNCFGFGVVFRSFFSNLYSLICL